MTGIMLAVFLGWAGGYRFYKGQTKMGIIYLFTCGLFGIGWIIDVITAIKEQEKHNRSISSGFAMTSKVVGTFAECRKNESVKRKQVIKNLHVGSPLVLETAYFEGKPFFLVVDPSSGLDIGALPKENSGFLKGRFPSASFKATLTDTDPDNPVIDIEVAR